MIYEMLAFVCYHHNYMLNCSARKLYNSENTRGKINQENFVNAICLELMLDTYSDISKEIESLLGLDVTMHWQLTANGFALPRDSQLTAKRRHVKPL